MKNALRTQIERRTPPDLKPREREREKDVVLWTKDDETWSSSTTGRVSTSALIKTPAELLINVAAGLNVVSCKANDYHNLSGLCGSMISLLQGVPSPA